MSFISKIKCLLWHLQISCLLVLTCCQANKKIAVFSFLKRKKKWFIFDLNTVPTKFNASKHENNFLTLKYNITKDQTTSCQIIAYIITNPQWFNFFIWKHKELKYFNERSQEVSVRNQEKRSARVLRSILEVYIHQSEV